MIDRAGLEIRYTPFGYRGFESLTFRTEEYRRESQRLSFPLNKGFLQNKPDLKHLIILYIFFIPSEFILYTLRHFLPVNNSFKLINNE